MRPAVRRRLSCTAAAGFVAVLAAGQSDLRIGMDYNRYESRYGKPEDRSLDENPATWPEGQAIRTLGDLVRQPQMQTPQRRSENEPPRASPRIYSLHGQFSLALHPAPEITDQVAFHAPFWLGREVEVVGAFPRQSPSELGSGLAARRTFLVWSMAVLPEREDDAGFDAPRSSLEDLVIDGEAGAGRMVQVTGVFRVGNLLEDLSKESRRDAGDWVLGDGPFSIWVTGKKPEGDGFALDPRARSDLGWKLAVQGEVEIHDGFVYLRAERLRLVGPARGEAGSVSP